MPFVELNRRDQGAPKAPVAMKLIRKKGGIFCSITIRSTVLGVLGWKKAEPLSVLLGDGTDAGKILIEEAGTRLPFAKLHMLKATGIIHLGKVATFGNSPTREIEVSYSTVTVHSAIGLEITLPNWAEHAVDEDDEIGSDNDERVLPKSHVKAPMPPVAPPRAPESVAIRTGNGSASAPTIKSRQSVGKDGVWIHFAPRPMIANDSQSIEVTERQATWLAVLLPAMGKGVLPTDLIQERSGIAAATIAIDFRELVRPLAAVNLRLAHQPKFGYALNKA